MRNRQQLHSHSIVHPMHWFIHPMSCEKIGCSHVIKGCSILSSCQEAKQGLPRQPDFLHFWEPDLPVFTFRSPYQKNNHQKKSNQNNNRRCHCVELDKCHCVELYLGHHVSDAYTGVTATCGWSYGGMLKQAGQQRGKAHILEVGFTGEECWDCILGLDNLFWREKEANGHSLGLCALALLLPSSTAINALCPPLPFPVEVTFNYLHTLPPQLFSLSHSLSSLLAVPLSAFLLWLVSSPRPTSMPCSHRHWELQGLLRALHAQLPLKFSQALREADHHPVVSLFLLFILFYSIFGFSPWHHKAHPQYSAPFYPIPTSNPVAVRSLLSSQGYMQPIHAWAPPPLLYIQPAKEDLHSSLLLLLLTTFPVWHALKELHKLHQLPLADKGGLSGKKRAPSENWSDIQEGNRNHCLLAGFL